MATSTIDKRGMREYLMDELPVVLEENPTIQRAIVRISRRTFAGKDETRDWFERMLEENRRDREAAEQRWEENNKRWKENQQKLEEMQRQSDERWAQSQQRFEEIQRESNERWAQSQQRFEEIQRESNERWAQSQQRFEEIQRESNERWEKSEQRFEEIQRESNERWEKSEQKFEEMQRESNERWEKNQQKFEEMRRESDERFEQLMEEIKALSRKHDSSIGALGARWGIAAESSFRDGLKAILEQDFGVQVVNVTEYDEEGEVFGRPDQVELDLIIHNGDLIICEIKSSMSRSDMYAFFRKVQFYEKRHQRKATKLMVISPMVDQRAKAVADTLGIAVYSYADDVQLERSETR